MMLAEEGIHRHIAQRVVHEAHIPLEQKTQPPVVGRFGDHRVSRRFFRNGHDAGVARQNHGIELLQKSHRGAVDVAPVFVGHKFARIAGVVQVEHRCDRIHANPVDVAHVKEKHRAGNQKACHLGTGIVENQRAPLRVIGLHRVLMFVETGAVKARQAVFVPGKMSRHPVHDDADAFGVHDIDKIHEILRRPVAAGYRVKTGYLIPPGIVQRMFENGHNLHMREAHLDQIIGKLVSNLTKVRERISLSFPPRIDVHFVNGDRPVQKVLSVAPLQIFRIAPVVSAQAPDL